MDIIYPTQYVEEKSSAETTNPTTMKISHKALEFKSKSMNFTLTHHSKLLQLLILNAIIITLMEVG